MEIRVKIGESGEEQVVTTLEELSGLIASQKLGSFRTYDEAWGTLIVLLPESKQNDL